MNLNKVMIIGNLTRDPEVRSTPQGASVVSFSVATNFGWTDANGQRQEKAEYHNVVAWRKLAEIIGQYLRKGSKVYIEGRLQTRDWVGQDGVKKYRTEIVAENMIMLDRPGDRSTSTHSPAPATDIPVIEEETAPALKKETETDSDEIKLEDIPF
ncbi:single-stranded DNA-binding protein [Candidatus Falkowbacteria bacterium]|nr:single-stranded DNA-binding protein [Candidatus Falkowbacteria bacterium]